jgi:hypothetical protein
METRIVTLAELESWQLPPVQGVFKVNKRVLEYVDELKRNGGIIGGVITLGRLPNDARLWKVDGCHRTQGAIMSGLTQFFVEIRTIEFQTMGELAEEYVKMNTPLSRKTPNDILRAMEENLPNMRLLHEQCSFIGYDNIRRCVTSSPIIGMAQVLRTWNGAKQETPGGGGQSGGPREIAEEFDARDVEELSSFLNSVYGAWGMDPEYHRLWGSLNLTMCMWLFQQLVLGKREPRKKTIYLTVAQFGRCMMSVSASGDYVDWVRGRQMSERDRSPCYTRLKKIIGMRILEDTGQRPMFPQPAWYSGGRK